MGRESNILQIWGNRDSMNLNSMILTNIQCSTYFKQNLYELKTYHEVVDEIYYRVTHLEPWEKGSRRTQGLTGMCGGVRGVGSGGIVSTAFCLLYKLYTLKLTRKQVIGLITHTDSPYIRGLGFMYIRYTQNPEDLWYWYSDYLDDEEEIDVKAGGGLVMTIGQMLKQWLTHLDWFDTLFPRIPVPIQKEIVDSLRDRYGNSNRPDSHMAISANSQVDQRGDDDPYHRSTSAKRSPMPERANSTKRSTRSRSRSRSRHRAHRHSNRDRSRSRSRDSSRRRHRSGSRSRHRHHKKHRHHRKRSESRSNGEESDGTRESRSHKNHTTESNGNGHRAREGSDDESTVVKKSKKSKRSSRSPSRENRKHHKRSSRSRSRENRKHRRRSRSRST